MKKKSLALLFVLLIIATLLCFSLVGCVSNKYDFSKFFPQDNNYSISTSYALDNETCSDDLLGKTYLTGCLYELEYKTQYVGSSRCVLYNVFEGRTIENLDEQNDFKHCEVIKGDIDIVVCYTDYKLYKYFLPDGKLIYSNKEKVNATVNETYLNDVFKINFDGVVKEVVLVDYGYKISDGENNQSLNTGDSVSSSDDERLNSLKEKFGLGKNYSIDVAGYNVIVMKNKKIVSSFNYASLVDNIVAINNASILYFEKSAVPEDCNDYNVIIDGIKYNAQFKSFNLKNGKTKELKINYVIAGAVRVGANGDVLVGMKKINKNKTLSSRIEYFVLNGKGIVANVDKSFATNDRIYTIDKKSFIVETDSGLYIADKYLNIKKDFTKVHFVDAFVGEGVIIARQNINNKYKYGAIDMKGKVTIPFIYDEFSSFGGELYFKCKENDVNVNFVYDVKKLSAIKKYGDVDYLESGIIISGDRLVVAFTGQTILSEPNLNVVDSKTIMLGKSEIRIVQIEYDAKIFKNKVNVICKAVKRTIQD